MDECNHEWNCEIDEAEVIELEYTHVLARVQCLKCGMTGFADSELVWKPVFWDSTNLFDTT
jgi:hypothetical protein